MCNQIKEIEQVLYRACHAVDQGKLDAFLRLFHPEAVLNITWEENGEYLGHEGIRSWFVNYDQTVRSSMKYLRHKITCPLIQCNENSATAFSYLDVDAALKENGQVIITSGRYEDKLLKIEGNWLLKEKVIFMDNTYTV